MSENTQNQSDPQADESYHISTVRRHMIDQLRALRTASPETLKHELERAKQVAAVGQVIVDSARVEVEYLRATGQENTPFLKVPPDKPYVGLGSSTHDTKQIPSTANGITSITQHRLKG